MASSFALEEVSASLVCAAVARQIDLSSAPGRAVHFIEPEIDDRSKALQPISATRREAAARVACSKANLAFHETGRAPSATNPICAEQVMPAIAPLTGSLASHAPDGRQFDRLHRETRTAAWFATIKSRQ